MQSRSPSPPSKRVKLDDSEEYTSNIHEDDNGEHCSICLHAVVDRTIISTCSHEFCFECLLVWTGEDLCVFRAPFALPSDKVMNQSSHDDVHYARRLLENTSSMTFGRSMIIENTTYRLFVRRHLRLNQQV